MYGYSPKLPLVKDTVDGLYSMNKTALESVKQDLKMLILTNPGERIMNPDYGAGLRQLLFSQDTDSLRDQIKYQITNQVAKYMNFIQILEINFDDLGTNSDNNSIYVYVRYYIPSVNLNDELNLSLNAN